MAPSKAAALAIDDILAEERLTARSSNQGCRLGRWINEQPTANQIRLKELMGDPTQANAVLRRVVKRLGMEMGSETMIRKHRNTAKKSGGDGCACDKAGLL